MVGRLPHPTHLDCRNRWAAAIIGAAVVGVLVTRGRSFRRVQVTGDSMLPALRSGDRLLVGPTFGVRPGAVVAVVEPGAPGRLLVKRLHAVGPDWVDVRGDNDAASFDSRHFGPIPRTMVTGRIIYRYAPPGRAGWFPGARAGWAIPANSPDPAASDGESRLSTPEVR
jgi:nickel-type superoxide dismutase maturation protease